MPGAVVCAAGHTLFDKFHALDAIVHVGEDRITLVNGLSGRMSDHLVIAAAIDIGEGFKKSFRVPRGEPTGGLLGGVCEICIGVTFVNLHRFSKASYY